MINDADLFVAKRLVVIYFALRSVKLSAFLVPPVAVDGVDTRRTNIIALGDHFASSSNHF